MSKFLQERFPGAFVQDKREISILKVAKKNLLSFDILLKFKSLDILQKYIISNTLFVLNF